MTRFTTVGMRLRSSGATTMVRFAAAAAAFCAARLASAALAALRPRHADWAATVIEAKAWLSAALAQADSLEVGHGIGPVHHFHAWW